MCKLVASLARCAPVGRYVTFAVEVDPERPVLIDKYLDRAIELDVDALCDVNVRAVVPWFVWKLLFGSRRGLVVFAAAGCGFANQHDTLIYAHSARYTSILSSTLSHYYTMRWVLMRRAFLPD